MIPTHFNIERFLLHFYFKAVHLGSGEGNWKGCEVRIAYVVEKRETKKNVMMSKNNPPNPVIFATSDTNGIFAHLFLTFEV